MTTKSKQRAKARYDDNKHVHRSLALTSPMLRGKDIEKLQEATDRILDHYGFDWRLIQEDGEYGKRTRNAIKLAAWRIGLEDKLVDPIRKDGGHINEKVQELIRNPEKRTDAQRKLEKQRKAKAQKLIKKHHDGVQAVYDFLKKNVGKNEEPPESNHGPFPIDECQKFFGLSGQPWCGCLVGYAIRKVAGVTSVKGVWFPYAGSIRTDAEGSRNGLHDANVRNAKRGMVVTFFSGGDDHVGWIREDVKPGDTTIKTFEGNTSSATRDSDGGIIEEKERSFSEVSCVAVVEDWN